MLTAHNLYKTYGQIAVLKDVSLHIRKGELVSIVGPSGAGKSTLLHLMGGLDRPDSGSVELMGEPITQASRSRQMAFRNKQMGFVFQFHHLLPEFTALENVCMPLWIQGMSRPKATARATEVLDMVGLSHRLQHKPSAMSGGEQQRVAIARAIAGRPAVVFADEPTGNLDSANADSVHALFLQLRRDFQQTFLIVTHNENLAALSDRQLHMKDGQIIAPETLQP